LPQLRGMFLRLLTPQSQFKALFSFFPGAVFPCQKKSASPHPSDSFSQGHQTESWQYLSSRAGRIFYHRLLLMILLLNQFFPSQSRTFAVDVHFVPLIFHQSSFGRIKYPSFPSTFTTRLSPHRFCLFFSQPMLWRYFGLMRRELLTRPFPGPSDCARLLVDRPIGFFPSFSADV